MPEKVTVAVDGGPASDAAVAWVVDRALTVPLSVELTAVVGLDTELPAGAEVDFRGPFELALANAQRAITEAAPDLAVTTKLRHGMTNEALIRASQHADLLVIGTNKTSRLAGIMHGTLPLKVAGRSVCTTVVVPVGWSPSTGAVVVGWADNPTADEALDVAAHEASRRDATLRVVHSWSVPPFAPMDAAGAAMLLEDVAEFERQQLASAIERVQSAHPSLDVVSTMQSGSAAVAIVTAAQGASLVVVGSRGRGAIAGFFLGSVSHDVLLNMPAPVAVVPRKEEPIDVYPELLEEDI